MDKTKKIVGFFSSSNSTEVLTPENLHFQGEKVKFVQLNNNSHSCVVESKRGRLTLPLERLSNSFDATIV